MKLKRLIPLLFTFALVGCGKTDLPVKQVHPGEDGGIDTPYEDLMIPLKSLSFSGLESDLSLNIGQSHTYQYTYSPEKASLESLIWESKDPEIASVSTAGVVTANKKGETTITVSSKVKVDWAPINLHVEVYVPLEDFTLSANSLDLDYGETYQITAEFSPVDATNTGLKYISTDESIVSVDESGLITAKQISGNAKIIVGSDDNIGLSKEISVEVRDKTIHVNSVSVSSTVSELEIGKSTILNSSVLPIDAKEYLINGVTYVTSTPELVTLNAKTGEVCAKATGIAKFKATCEDVESNEISIKIYEVCATAINLLDESGQPAPSNINLSNKDNKNSYKLTYSYVTDKEGRDLPTYDEVSFISSDENVAKVNKEGLITGVGIGSAVITAYNPYYPVATASINVSMTVYPTKVHLFSVSDSVIVGETLTISATITPTAVSDPTVIFTVSDDTVANFVQDGNVITLVGLKEGEVTVSASCGELSDSKTIYVTDVFKEGQYIVGNADYSGLESAPAAKGSWNVPALARHMIHEESSTETELLKQFKETVVFSIGDIWKIREKDKYVEISSEEGSYVIDNGSAITTDGTLMGVEDGNVKVNTAGSYDIYYKIYKSGWYSVWVNPTPKFSINKTSLNLVVGNSGKVQAKHYVGSLSVTSDNLAVASVTTNEEGLATISAISTGNAIISFTDNNETLTCNVTVTAEQIYNNIYLNSNGIADKDHAGLWIHSWGGDVPAFDGQFTLVSGQSIIYNISIPSEHQHFVIVRESGTLESIDWDKYYNKTEDLNVTGNNMMWTMTGYGSADSSGKDYMIGKISTFDSSITYSIESREYILKAEDNWGIDSLDSSQAAIFAWVWGGKNNNNEWIKLDYKGSKTAIFNFGVDIDGFLIVRCHKNTVTPNWDEKDHEKPGCIYNKTNDFTGVTKTEIFKIYNWIDC